MSTQEIVSDEHVHTLTKIAGIVCPNKNQIELNNIVNSELGFLEQRLQLQAGLSECTNESLIHCVKQAIRDNLTLNRSAGLVYLIPQPINVGSKEVPEWVKVATYLLAPDGYISLARQTGGILDIERAKLILNGEGRVVGGSVNLLKPSYPTPRWELYEFEEWEIERWKAASTKKNRGVANPLYTSWKGGIDPEFMRAKIIKHSLSKLGTNINEIKNNEIPQVPVSAPEYSIEAPSDLIDVEHEEVVEAPTETTEAPESAPTEPNFFNNL